MMGTLYGTLLFALLLFCRLVSAQKWRGDALCCSTVEISLGGVWNPAWVNDSRFAAAVWADVNTALVSWRAVAWPNDNPPLVAVSGHVSVTLVVWGDPGTPVDHLLRATDWKATRAHFTAASGSDAAAPFVTAALREENLTVRFSGSMWGDETKFLEEELKKRIIGAVEAVEDAMSVPEKLQVTLMDTISRVNGLTFNLNVKSFGTQSIVSLFSSEETYRDLLIYYQTQVLLADSQLISVVRRRIALDEQVYRTQLRITLSGSWRLVLLTKKEEVLSLMRAALAGVLKMKLSHVLVFDATTRVHPFNMDVSCFILHSFTFDLSGIPSAVPSADFTRLTDLYKQSGGDSSIAPLVLHADFVTSNEPAGISDSPLISTHHVMVSGRFWSAVLSSAPSNVVRTVLAEDLSHTFPYIPVEVNVLSVDEGPCGVLTAHIEVTQLNKIRLIPIAVNTIFTQMDELPVTQTVYDKYKESAEGQKIKITLSSEVQPGHESRCEFSCIIVSIIGGSVFVLSIVIMFVLTTWMAFTRRICSNHQDSELICVPSYMCPLPPPNIAGGKGLDHKKSPFGNQHICTDGVGVFPKRSPISTEVEPFDASNLTLRCTASESPMISFVSDQYSTSMPGQSSVVNSSLRGEGDSVPS